MKHHTISSILPSGLLRATSSARRRATTRPASPHDDFDLVYQEGYNIPTRSHPERARHRARDQSGCDPAQPTPTGPRGDRRRILRRLRIGSLPGPSGQCVCDSIDAAGDAIVSTGLRVIACSSQILVRHGVAFQAGAATTMPGARAEAGAPKRRVAGLTGSHRGLGGRQVVGAARCERL